MTPRWADIESLRTFAGRIGPFDLWVGPFDWDNHAVALVWGKNSFVYSDSIEELRRRYAKRPHPAFHDAEFEAVCAALLLLGVAAGDQDVGVGE